MYKPKFFENYRDLSQPAGANAGFQFEFFCECCGDAWCTKRTPYRSSRVLARLSRLAGVFGGIAVSAWRAALKEAESQAQWHFRCCSTCRRHVCARCAGSRNGMCSRCAVAVGVTPVLRAHGELQSLLKITMVEGVARQVKHG